jgi:hypothetical protein
MCRSSSAPFSSAPTRRSPLICSEPVTPGADSARSLALQAGRSARAAADRQIAYRRLRNSESEAFSSNRVRRSYGSNRSPAAFLDNAGNHRRGRRRSFAPFSPGGRRPPQVGGRVSVSLGGRAVFHRVAASRADLATGLQQRRLAAAQALSRLALAFDEGKKRRFVGVGFEVSRNCPRRRPWFKGSFC